jgi:predicted Fe-S protein YdhL (DUF1289 family)
MDRPLTPCIKVCVIDDRTRLCEGCGRTIEEIGRWARLSEDERRIIMAELPKRMARAFSKTGQAGR